MEFEIMDTVKVLWKVPLFHDFKKEDIEKLVPLFTEEEFPAEAYIITEGAVGDSMYIIVSGSVKILKKVNEVEEMVINHLFGETYFGELALIDNLPRSASVVALEKTKILRLKKSVLDNLLDSNVDIAKSFYKNCLKDTFSRYRTITTEFTSSKHDLLEKSTTLAEISKDLSSAKKLQEFFINRRRLDHNISPIKGLKQSYIYDPCQEIGGDFLNLVEVGHRKYGAVIADVMGHGITAALATGAFKSAFSLMVKDTAENPSLLLASLNNHFFKDISSMFASCLFAFIDLGKKEITIARAGHYYPMFFRKELNDLESFELSGTALGIKKHAVYEQRIFEIKKGDKLLFYSDGIIEQRNTSGEMYSEKRLRSAFLSLAQSNAEHILPKIAYDLANFTSSFKKDDDITLLLMEFK
jgi:serine phosphatase RsbU (regulator of sigma subunit)